MLRPLLTLRKLSLIAFSVLALVQAPAQAELTIEIAGAGTNRIPLAIADFGGDAGTSKAVTTVVRGDLERSGLFKLIDPSGIAMTEATSPAYGDWKNRGADALAAGSIGASGDGRQEARFRLYDINKQSALTGSAFVTSTPMLRAAGHRIADAIYEKLIGEPGIFSTRIAYVVKNGVNRYELHIADADGQNAQAALKSREPIISPTWSPDGSRLAYVSFENKKPVVYVHSLASGQRIVAANFKGSNSAPAWSPDGRMLATGGKDGTLFVWDAVRGRAAGPGLQGHRKWVTAVSWEPMHSNARCDLLASASKDLLVKVWNWRTGRCLRRDPSCCRCYPCRLPFPRRFPCRSCCPRG